MLLILECTNAEVFAKTSRNLSQRRSIEISAHLHLFLQTTSECSQHIVLNIYLARVLPDQVKLISSIIFCDSLSFGSLLATILILREKIILEIGPDCQHTRYKQEESGQGRVLKKFSRRGLNIIAMKCLNILQKAGKYNNSEVYIKHTNLAFTEEALLLSRGK